MISKEIEIDGKLVPFKAYIMALHADPNQPGTPEEWLDQFNTFSIYTVLPQLLDLWHLNIETDVEAKKKRSRAAGK